MDNPLTYLLAEEKIKNVLELQGAAVKDYCKPGEYDKRTVEFMTRCMLLLVDEVRAACKADME